MARKARVEYEGAVYHDLDRGDRREAIFAGSHPNARCFQRASVLLSSSSRLASGMLSSLLKNGQNAGWDRPRDLSQEICG
jgi:hypothetical protein